MHQQGKEHFPLCLYPVSAFSISGGRCRAPTRAWGLIHPGIKAVVASLAGTATPCLLLSNSTWRCYHNPLLCRPLPLHCLMSTSATNAAHSDFGTGEMRSLSRVSSSEKPSPPGFELGSVVCRAAFLLFCSSHCTSTFCRQITTKADQIPIIQIS